MPEEEFVLAIIAMVSTATVLSIFVLSLFGYARARLKRKERAKGDGASLTTSELHRLMRAAVEEATAPLVDQIASLEARLDENAAVPQLAPHRTGELIDSLDASADADGVRHRARQSQ